MAEPTRRELTEQILGAEQDERRRIALFLHDGPVQSLAGIALMLDAALHFIEQGRGDEALAVLRRVVELGVNHIDPAQFYGPDVSNELIREALHPYPADLALVSKVGARRDLLQLRAHAASFPP